MKIRIKTDKINLNIPVPLSMAGFTLRNLPDSVFADLRRKLEPPYNVMICKENAVHLFEACKDELADNPGLEIIRAKKGDGTFVSIVL